MAEVVYVHGLWMSGDEALLLKRRLATHFNLALHVFRYGAGGVMSDITARLAAFVHELQAEAVHLVGHSLGGLVIYRLLERCRDLPPGRVVFLGTPSVASRAAERVAAIKLFAGFMGRCVAEELLQQHARHWSAPRELGIIAGTQPLGLGQFFAHFEEEHDGTVAVGETRLPGATAHLTLPVSHLGMLLSEQVAQETGEFLTRGRFTQSSDFSR